MKTQVTLLAVCLLGAGLANGQSTTNTSSNTSTNSTYSASPSTTMSTDSSNRSGTMNSTSPSSTSNSNGSTMSNGSMNSTGTMNNGTTYGTTTTSTSGYNASSGTMKDKSTKGYKNFVFGIYAGLNTTKFKGEALNATGGSDGKLTGRLGYQGGFFVRGGGRLYGQIGAEYFASSSNYFTAGQGTVKSTKDQIDIKYIQVPVYIGYKLTQSDRGISAVRLQVGLEYANQIGSTANQFGNLNNFQVKNGTFNGLGQLGFDAGPIFLDLTYHYGFSNAIQQNTGFAGSQRRILSASVGFKF